MGAKLPFHLSLGKLPGYRVYLRNASTTKYISLSILHCRALRRFLHPPLPLSLDARGSFSWSPAGHPYSSSDPAADRSSQLTAGKILRIFIPDEGHSCYIISKKGTMAFNFHGPWATRAMQEPALQILAAVLHHRC